ncbi:hypothetical protein BH23BAC2_BH23BAC2_05510 [soil metagenome]
MKSHSIKPPIILKTLLDVIFWFTLVGLLIRIAFTGLYYFSVLPVDLRVNGNEINEFNTALVIGLVFKIFITALFIYIIYLLRKVVRSFFNRKLFTALQISGLRLIGQMILISTLAEMAVNVFLKLSFQEKNGAGDEMIDSFHSLWFLLAIGLFFILLSRSFSYARQLQLENELTV